jgi:hypothetical protein
MPKRNLILMTGLALAVLSAMGFLALAPSGTSRDSRAALGKLVRELGDTDPDIQKEGEAGLRQAGSAAVEVLREAVRDRDRGLAARAARLLGELEPPALGQ